MGGSGDLEKFITGSVGYVKLTVGQVATFDENTGREMNAIIADGDATATVVQYNDFYNGAEVIADGNVVFGKFSSVTATVGTLRVYSTGGSPTIV